MPVIFASAGSDLQLSYCRHVANHLGYGEWDYHRTTGMGVFTGKNLAGAVIFHDYQPHSGVMCMSAAGKRGWLSLESLFKCHRYIFDESGCQLSVLQVSEKNKHMIKTAKHYGYSGHLISRLRGRDEAEIIFTLGDDEWRSSKFTQRYLSRVHAGLLETTGKNC